MHNLISGPALDKLLGKSRWSRRRLVSKDPTFPKPIKLAANSLVWVEAEVAAWIKAKMAARDAQAEQKPE